MDIKDNLIPYAKKRKPSVLETGIKMQCIVKCIIMEIIYEQAFKKARIFDYCISFPSSVAFRVANTCLKCHHGLFCIYIDCHDLLAYENVLHAQRFSEGT